MRIFSRICQHRLIGSAKLFFNFNNGSQYRYLSSNNGKKFTSFDSMIDHRRLQAQKSVLVQVHSGYSYEDLTSYCSQFGKVENSFYYSTKDDLHFILVEFNEEDAAKNLIENSSYGSKIPSIPVSSPFLWLRANKTSRKNVIDPPETISDKELSSEYLLNLLQNSESVSNQIEILYKSTCLTDLGSRLRFLTARQLELSLFGMFPNIRALPFGSSVNGFGKAGCDLDLVLQLGGLEEGQTENRSTKTNSRLIFHTKSSSACNGRAQLQRQMEVIADLIHLFLPGCSKVVRILQARVPIIKYRQDLTMVECDLSMTNMTALYMSELLFLLGEIDSRVRPLVFTIRRWAQNVGLTNQTPGRWISNFSLTLLVLYFLQSRKNPILPTLNNLINLAGENDRRITAEGINCTFLRDTTNLRESNNQDNLEDLLKEFFEYYSSFDFSHRGISLVSGKTILKADHAPLYIENPIERILNVSKNVSPEETLRLQIELRNAAWLLEQEEDEGRNPNRMWGLLSLLQDSKTKSLKSSNKSKSYRLVHIKDLFSTDNDFRKTPNRQTRR